MGVCKTREKLTTQSFVTETSHACFIHNLSSNVSPIQNACI